MRTIKCASGRIGGGQEGRQRDGGLKAVYCERITSRRCWPSHEELTSVSFFRLRRVYPMSHFCPLFYADVLLILEERSELRLPHLLRSSAGSPSNSTRHPRLWWFGVTGHNLRPALIRSPLPHSKWVLSTSYCFTLAPWFFWRSSTSRPLLISTSLITLLRLGTQKRSNN